MNHQLVGSPPILLSIGVGKSARTPLTLDVSPSMASCALVRLYGGFVPWGNLYNLLKS